MAFSWLFLFFKIMVLCVILCIPAGVSGYLAARIKKSVDFDKCIKDNQKDCVNDGISQDNMGGIWASYVVICGFCLIMWFYILIKIIINRKK